MIITFNFFSGNWPARRQLFYRILLGSWCLSVMVLVNAYSSLLSSYLTIPKLIPAEKDFNDMVFNPIFKNLASISEKNSIKSDLIDVSIRLKSYYFILVLLVQL